jgi:hypothetical protein
MNNVKDFVEYRRLTILAKMIRDLAVEQEDDLANTPLQVIIKALRDHLLPEHGISLRGRGE